MTGGEAVAAALAAHGVDTVFGLPGAHNLSLYDALIEAPIRHVLARHEQGAAFMADGYARACGRPGVCVVTSGPAALNTITSLGTAYSDSSPVLCIASQIPAAGIGKEKGYLHECSDQLACFRPVTGWCGRADSVAAIPGLLREAFASMSSGRPRPAALEIPCDVLDASGEAEIGGPIQVERLQPGDAAVEEAAAALREAESPVIWAGGGVIASGASAELRQLAETLQAPVFTTVLGKGAFPEDHPLAAGTAILHPLAQEFLARRDVVLAVGTRFTEEETSGWRLRLPETLIHLDVDAGEIGRNYPASAALVGDARESLRALVDRLAGLEPRSRTAEVAALRKGIVDDCRELAPEGVELVLPPCRKGCRATPSWSATSRWRRTGAGACSSSTSRAATSIRGDSAPSASACPRPSGRSWPARSARSSASRGTQGSCSTVRSWRSPRKPACRSSFCCSTTTASGPCGPSRSIASAANTPSMCTTRISPPSPGRSGSRPGASPRSGGWGRPWEALEAGVPALIEVPVALPPQIMEPGPRALFEAARSRSG